MEFRDLKRMAKRGEGRYIEFKQKVYYPHKILREVVAFANTEGGHLLIGVADNGHIKGVKNAEGEIFELERALLKYCKPLPDYEIHKVTIPEGRQVVVFEIFEAEKKPIVLFPKQEQEGKRVVYVRSADKSIQASKEMTRVLRDRSKNRRVMLRIGEPERQLLQYLSEKERISLQKYIELIHLPRRVASAILVKMTLANVIEIHPQEGGYDYFVEVRH